MSYIECPACGVYNATDAKECARCKKSFEVEEIDPSEVLDSRIMYIIASEFDEAELAIGETFENYVRRIDATEPYGKDKDDLAHLFPMTGYEHEPAWREEMGYRSDWGDLRKTGIGWKLNPTLFIALFFFGGSMFLLPLIYYIYSGSMEIFSKAFIDSMVFNLPYVLIIAIITKIIGYSQLKLDNLLKPYGPDHVSIKLLFKDDLEYLKFSKKFFRDVMSMKWAKFGAVGFIGYMIPTVMAWFSLDQYIANMYVPIPLWTFIFVFMGNIGIALLIFLLLTFLVAIFYGLFKIGNLGNDRENLSITKFGAMIHTINRMISEAQIKKTRLVDTKLTLDISGKTYYEFQRGNRKIGEFLFNIAAILIMMSVSFAILVWLAGALNLIPPALAPNLAIFTTALTVFGFMSFAIFILPQFSLHRFLKDFKYNLIDEFSSLAARLEYLYFEAMIHPEFLSQIDEEWQQRKDLLDDIDLIKETVSEIKSYGTWSYDFPEIMKLIVVGSATLIPILLTMTGQG